MPESFNFSGLEEPKTVRGVSFPEGGFMPCADDEDICDMGSGDSSYSGGIGGGTSSNYHSPNGDVKSK